MRRSRELDPSAAVLWLLAVSTAIAAALWAGSDFGFEAKLARSNYDDEVQSNRQASGARPSRGPALEDTGALHVGQRKPFAFSKHEVQSRPLACQGFYTSSHPPLHSSRSSFFLEKAAAIGNECIRLLLQGPARKAPGVEVQVVTAQTAVGFVCFASIMLMLLYFFLNHVFAIVLVSLRQGPDSFSHAPGAYRDLPLPVLCSLDVHALHFATTCLSDRQDSH